MTGSEILLGATTVGAAALALYKIPWFRPACPTCGTNHWVERVSISADVGGCLRHGSFLIDTGDFIDEDSSP